MDKTAHMQRVGRMIWDAIHDGTIFSCPSLLCSFSAICFADLKTYKFTYHFAFPAIHSDPQWKLIAPEGENEVGTSKLAARETKDLVDAVQTWRYKEDPRQHGFFLAKRLHRKVLKKQWDEGTLEIEGFGRKDGNLHQIRNPKKSRKRSLSKLGFLWHVKSLASFESGFFDNVEYEDRFICFADPSTYPENPGWMLRNLLVLVRQRWHLNRTQIICYRDVHARRDEPSSVIMNLASATSVLDKQLEQSSEENLISQQSSTPRPDDVDAFGELVEAKLNSQPSPKPKSPVTPPGYHALPKVTGWERNENHKILSRTVDLARYLDYRKLSDQAVDLNLKLIKWRMSPSIDLDVIKDSRCLLLGAGTLGSYVARNLLGWGVSAITLVDNGQVSFSNPVRQPLYVFGDASTKSKKAQQAAVALSKIHPGVEATGYDLRVPMLGHPILDHDQERKDFLTLRQLIYGHDAIFLLTDTRESRWLPTVMAKACGKLVINAALGFDTYVVMRHGLLPRSNHGMECPDSYGEDKISLKPGDPDWVQPIGAVEDDWHVRDNSCTICAAKALPDGGEEVGCYFCSDVVAPVDSRKSATLDQQCTVTRPGAAPIAAANAVELFVSLTQHRLRGRAPAPPTPSTTGIQPAPPMDPSLPGYHPLGTVPHQIRGYMSTWQTIQVQGRAYDCCAACSPRVINAYKSGSWNFVQRALNDKGFVERISGLAEVQRKAEEAVKEMEGWSDEEDEGLLDEGEMV